MMRFTALLLAACAFAAAAASSTPGGAAEPKPLSGAPLPPTTKLQLLVADDPPFVLDVDNGRVLRARGVPETVVGPVSVVPVGGRAAVVVAGGGAAAPLYAVGRPRARAVPLGVGAAVWPTVRGDAVWVQSGAARGCRLRQVALDGRVLRRPRAFPCAAASDPSAGSLGLAVNRTWVVSPANGRNVLRTRAGILAGAGSKLVLLDGRRLTLLDAGSRRERPLGWPSSLDGSDAPAVDPRGRYVVLAFADPAWAGGKQVLDLWLLDVRTAELSQLPSMPAFLGLKGTSIAWTDDGRLVLLGETDTSAVVAVWRPGEARLRVKKLALPRRDGGSDTFAPLG